MIEFSFFSASDKSIWWKVEHINDGRIGYIPRNLVVIDYSQEYDTICS